MKVSSFRELSLIDLRKGLKNKEFSSVELVEYYRRQWKKDLADSEPIHAYVEFFDSALALAKERDDKRSLHGGKPLWGLPILIKDNMLYQNHKSSCASVLLKDFKAPYTATVLERLLTQGAIFLGRANMDEFAMGSFNTHTAYPHVRNPFNKKWVAGGSSGGSAAAVAADLAPFSLGSDTGGSVRVPASYCNLYGFKPSYGSLSRYGLVAYASSFDQIGFLARSVEDIALCFRIASGQDNYDQSMHSHSFVDLDIYKSYKEDLRYHKVLVLENFLEHINPRVQEKLELFMGFLRKEGLSIEFVKDQAFEDVLSLYYIISTVEAASNLARYDGIRYGQRHASEDLLKTYIQTRASGFGDEVKKRIASGYYLSSSYQGNDLYTQALALKDELRARVQALFERYDFILSPTSLYPPFPLEEVLKEDFQGSKADKATVLSNLAEIPAISLPIGFSLEGFPIGMQLSTRFLGEGLLLKFAHYWNKEGLWNSKSS